MFQTINFVTPNVVFGMDTIKQAGAEAKKLDASVLEGDGIGIVNLIKTVGLVPSNGEGFRTIEQGGLTMNGEKVTDPKMTVTREMFGEDGIIFKKGKKTFLKVEL